MIHKYPKYNWEKLNDEQMKKFDEIYNDVFFYFRDIEHYEKAELYSHNIASLLFNK